MRLQPKRNFIHWLWRKVKGGRKVIRKIGVLADLPSKEILDRELTNGWDLVLVASEAGRPIFGDGHQIYFKIATDKLPISSKLEKLGWSVRGYNSYLLTGVPIDVIMRQLLEIFPGVEFTNATTGNEINISR